jgi:uncharacterized protein
MMKTKQVTVPVKHVPQRTCVSCRKTGAKKEFIRLVCGTDQKVEVDLTGRKPGRGAYLCTDPKCWDTAVKTGKIEHSFRTKLTQDSIETLVNYAKGLNNTK